nr:MATE family efflux transporter [uncultured Anaerobutyricum sp.]
MQSKKRSRQMDMLHGSLLDKILLFALPLAASSILQQLFNSADAAVAGRFAGSQALAAVGGNAPVVSLIINLFVGMSVGANVIIANYIGQKNTKKVHEAVHTVYIMALVLGIVMMMMGQLIARPILILINTPSDVINLATLYLRIYFCGMPCVMIYNFGAAILRSVGDTKRPLYCLFISGVINVVLNVFFVVLCHLSVAGVAIATVIADTVSAGLVTWFLIRSNDIIKLNLRELTLKKEYIKKVVQIGAPAGLQGAVFSVSNVCIQAGINSFGTAAIAGSAAALNFEYFTYFSTNAFGQAAVTFVSQNYGARQFERCKKALRLSLISGMIVTAFMSIIFVAGRTPFISIYTNDSAAIQYGIVRMAIVEMFEFIACLYEIPGGALRGIGHSLLPAILTVFGSCGLRIVWIYTVFHKFHTFQVLMSVYLVTWIVTSILVLGAYTIVTKKVYRT